MFIYIYIYIYIKFICVYSFVNLWPKRGPNIKVYISIYYYTKECASFIFIFP